MINQPPELDLYLASASPRRGELLAAIGVRFERLSTSIDEIPLADETPRDYVARLALAKARAGQNSLGSSDKPPLPVLGADTTVVIDQTILGKPANRAAGLAMLAKLSGREHQVFSGVALVADARDAVRVHMSTVRFRPISETERLAYWASGEPADKAGGYGIQALGAVFVEELHGSHSGVMGLPLYETANLLADFGIDIWRQS